MCSICTSASKQTGRLPLPTAFAKNTTKPSTIMFLTTILFLLSTTHTNLAAPTLSHLTRAAACPLYLPQDGYEYPHLMVPISSSSPDASMGNTYSPTMSPNDIATIFNFDIPVSRTGQQCTLYFTFPDQSQLVTSSYSFVGPGTFEFAMYQYGQGATSATTWATQPSVVDYITLSGIMPGTSHVVWHGDCGSGGLMSWRMKSLDSCFWYFQDWNECAIGAYIVYGNI